MYFMAGHLSNKMHQKLIMELRYSVYILDLSCVFSNMFSEACEPDLEMKIPCVLSLHGNKWF